MDFGGAYSALSQIPIDWMIIGVLFVVVTADAMRAGAVRAGSLALSFPITAYLFQLLSQTLVLSTLMAQFSKPLEQAIIFAILEVIIFVCMHQMLSSFDPYTSMVSSVASGLAATAVVLAVWTGSPALMALWHFSGPIQAVFGASYRLFWITAAYLALAFVGS